MKKMKEMSLPVQIELTPELFCRDAKNGVDAFTSKLVDTVNLRE